MGQTFFIANDNSGSVDALENVQGRQLTTALADRVAPLGNVTDQSRFAINTYDTQWTQFPFPSVDLNYTTLLSDVDAYETAPRNLSGGTDIYSALLRAYQHVRDTPVTGRLVPQVIVLMTDTACGQVNNNIIQLANDIKADDIYIIVLAIDGAGNCPILQGENIASPNVFLLPTPI